MAMHAIIYLFEPAECVTTRVNHNVNCELWKIMMYHYMFINCNKRTTSRGLLMRQGYACVGAQGIWEISVPSPQFCCEPSVQFSRSVVSDSATPSIAARQASPSITNSRSSLRLTSIKSVMPSSHLILCHPLLLLPRVPPSFRFFSNESTLRMRWPKYWSFSFSIIPSKEIPGLISFRMDWLDFLVVRGILKCLLQHHSSKASILRHSAFFPVQLSHPYMTTGKTIALTRRTLVGKVMSLLFNMLSTLIVTFLPRSKRLLISWLQSPSAVVSNSQRLEATQIFTG